MANNPTIQQKRAKRSKARSFFATLAWLCIGGGIGYGSFYLWQSCSITIPISNNIFDIIENEYGQKVLLGFNKGITPERIIKELGNTLTIPDDVNIIDDNAFWVNGSSTIPNELVNLDIPSSVYKIGANAFNSAPFECSAQAPLSLPDTIQEIGASAFANCKEIKGVHIPYNNEVKIGDEAFANCNKLEVIDLCMWTASELSLDLLGNDLFKNVSPKGVIYAIPKNTRNYKQFFIDQYGFIFDDEHWRFEPDMTSVLDIKEHILYGFADWATKEDILAEFSDGIIHIPNGVTTVADNAFYKPTRLVETIPEEIDTLVFDDPLSVTEIGDVSFFMNENIQRINLDELVNLKKIGNYAFTSCKNLQYFTTDDTESEQTILKTPFGMKYIGNDAFEGCSSIQGLCLLPLSFDDSEPNYVGQHAFVFNSDSFNYLDLHLLSIGDIDISDQDIGNWEYQENGTNDSLLTWLNACEYETLFSIEENTQGQVLLPYACDDLRSKVGTNEKAFTFVNTSTDPEIVVSNRWKSLNEASHSAYYWIGQGLNIDQKDNFVRNWNLIN